MNTAIRVRLTASWHRLPACQCSQSWLSPRAWAKIQRGCESVRPRTLTSCSSRMSGRLRGAPQEIVARQIDRICAPQLKSAERLTATQNGGYHVSRAHLVITVCNQTSVPDPISEQFRRVQSGTDPECDRSLQLPRSAGPACMRPGRADRAGPSSAADGRGLLCRRAPAAPTPGDHAGADAVPA